MTGEPPQFPPPPPQQPPFPPPTAVAPARDPLVPHLVWEGFLLLVALVLLVVAVVTGPTAGAVAQTLFINAAIIGLMATGFAFSLRTATPNLAVGAISATAGMLFVKLAQGGGTFVAMIVAVLVATVIGAVLGAIAGGLSVPGWAVTFGGALALQGILLIATKGQLLALRHLTQPTTALWFGLFLVASVGGGLLWLLVPPVRLFLSARRRTGDPGTWAGVGALLAALAGLGVSGLLAGLSGVLEAERIASASVSDGTTTMSIAVGAVLLGGVSVFGRRAGVAGTFLGVMILATAQTIMLLNGLESGWFLIVAAVAIVAGLAVSRLLETIPGLLGRGGAPAPGPALMSDPR
jgi:ribose transport system permease protein